MHSQPVLHPGNLEQNIVAGAGTHATAPCGGGFCLGRILIADREKKSCETLRDYLEPTGYEIHTVSSSASLEQRWRALHPDLALLDSTLPGCNMTVLIPKLQASHPFIPLIILANPDAIGLGMEALRLGADQVVPKPFSLPLVAAVIQRNLDYQRLRLRHIAEKLHHRSVDPFIGESDAIRSLAELARKAGLTDSPVVIEGERGTGKKLLASWLYKNGRALEPLIQLNCESLRRNGIERELVGGREHQTLAEFSEIAHRCTVVLAEIQNIDLKAQAKLLRLLGKENSRRSAAGPNRDIRFITTTQVSVAELLQAKRIRADLHLHISGFTLRIPPLRERLQDLPLLASQVLANLAEDLGTKEFDLTRRALQVLQGHTWPGNIRELKIVLERAVLLARSTLLTAADLQLPTPTGIDSPAGLQFQDLKEVEQQYIERALHSVGGRVQAAARILGVPRSSLYHKLKQYRSERLAMRVSSGVA